MSLLQRQLHSPCAQWHCDVSLCTFMCNFMFCDALWVSRGVPTPFSRLCCAFACCWCCASIVARPNDRLAAVTWVEQCGVCVVCPAHLFVQLSLPLGLVWCSVCTSLLLYKKLQAAFLLSVHTTWSPNTSHRHPYSPHQTQLHTHSFVFIHTRGLISSAPN